MKNSEDLYSNTQRRSKRSLENNIGLIGYYFRSIEFKMSTSSDETQDISLSFQKTENGFAFDCKGFNGYANASAEYEKEILSVSLDIGLSSGLENSDPYLSLRGNGVFGYYTTYGKGKFKIVTPYEDFESIDLEFMYDLETVSYTHLTLPTKRIV